MSLIAPVLDCIPQPIWRKLMEPVGWILLYSVGRELRRGNTHEASHLAAALSVGGTCDTHGPCVLRGETDFPIPKSGLLKVTPLKGK